MPRLAFVAPVTLLYTLAIAFLMVSRLPVFSGKRVGKRVPPEMVLPVFVLVVLFFALLIAYPWEVLTIGTRALSRQPAVRLALLSRIPAQGRGRRRAFGRGRACARARRIPLALAEPPRAPAGAAGSAQLERRTDSG